MRYQVKLGVASLPALIFGCNLAYAEIGAVGTPVPSASQQKQEILHLYDTLKKPPVPDDIKINKANGIDKNTVIKKIDKATPAKDLKSEELPVDKAANSIKGETEGTPILEIDFSQKHVYFDKQLRQAISSTESTQIGTTYLVVSHVPTDNAGQLRIERLNESFQGNLDDVVRQMQKLGVPSDRIESKTDSSNDITTQKVTISVK